MFLTSGNETGTPFGLLRPWQVYNVPVDYVNGLSDENKRCLEISQFPRLINKRYYTGCLKDGDRLCIKRLGGAGDIIWTLPIARELKKRYPKLAIVYWVSEKDIDLLKNNPFIDGIICNPTITDLENIEYILDFYESIERFNPAENEEAYDLHWKRFAFNSEFSGQATGNIYLTAKEIKDCKAVFGEGYVVVAMSSSNPKRTYYQLPIIIERLAKEGHEVIVTGQGQFNIPKHENIKNLINFLSLRELLTVIKNSKVLISTDSGNVHFAAQLGVPAVALYSTAHMKTRTKYYPKVFGIQSKAWCAPCVKLGEYCPNEPECLSQISTDDVMDKVKEALNCNI